MQHFKRTSKLQNIKNSDMLDKMEMLDMVDSFECCRDFCVVLILVARSKGVTFKDSFEHFQGRESVQSSQSVKSVKSVSHVTAQAFSMPRVRFGLTTVSQVGSMP